MHLDSPYFHDLDTGIDYLSTIHVLRPLDSNIPFFFSAIEYVQ